MPRFITVLALLSAIAISSCSQSLNADDIIKGNIKARGGYEKIKSLRSVIFEGTTTGNNGEVQTKVWYEHNKAMRADFSYNGKTGYTIISTEGGWNFNPFDGKGAVPMEKKYLDESLFQLDIQGLFVDYKEKGYTAEYLGKDTAAGRSCYSIKLVKKNEGNKIYFFDEEYLLRKTITYRLVADGSFQPGANYYDDYRKVDNGYLFSYKRTDGRGYKTVFTTITVNTSIPVSTFKPAE